jgi:hypothetical protein
MLGAARIRIDVRALGFNQTRYRQILGLGGVTAFGILGTTCPGGVSVGSCGTGGVVVLGGNVVSEGAAGVGAAGVAEGSVTGGGGGESVGTGVAGTGVAASDGVISTLDCT